MLTYLERKEWLTNKGLVGGNLDSHVASLAGGRHHGGEVLLHQCLSRALQSHKQS